jgi:hypothetical protein
LYAELHDGGIVPLRCPAFASRAGRDLLLGIALDEAALEGDRVRALALLADRRTCWPEPSAAKPDRALAIGEAEQVNLIDRLAPLLKSSADRIRGAAAAALLSASDPADGARAGHTTKRAVAPLTAAYRAEMSGPSRDNLAEAVCVLGGPEHWRQVSGNPRGLRGLLRDFGRRDAKVFFWLELRGGLAVFSCPQLRLERVEKDGKVVETKEEPLPVANPPRSWNDGWAGTPYLLVEFPVGNLAPGTWRLTVAGTAGKGADKVKWRAEPRTLVITAPPEAVVNPPW